MAWNLNNEDHKVAQEYQLSPEQYEEVKKVYEAYVFFMTFYPGILSIFAGDEMGVQGIGNLDNRKTMPWDKPDTELLEFFRNAGCIRKEETFMRDAKIIPKNININYAVFERIKDEESILVVVNRTGDTHRFIVPDEYKDSEHVYTLRKSKPGMVSPYGGIAIKRTR